MEETFKVTLSDNTVYDNLIKNGSYFITQEEITEDNFKGKLSTITINTTIKYDDGTTTETEEVLTDCDILPILIYDKDYWFAFRQKSSQEIETMKTRSDIEYIAMMTEVDLEEV